MTNRTILLIVLAVLLGVTIIGLAYYYAVESPFRLRTMEARARILKGEFTTFLDVRSDLEYWAGHYPGAVHIPTGQLLEDAYNMLPNLEEKILVYCNTEATSLAVSAGPHAGYNTGQRAKHATHVLRSLGYKNVFYISGAYWTLL